MGKKPYSKNPQIQKIPKNIENPQSYFDSHPRWSFKYVDVNYEKWNLFVCEDLKKILEELKDYEGMPWKEILKAAGGRKNGTNNHYDSIDELSPETKNRWRILKRPESEIFSLRIQGKKRLFGLIEDGVFEIIWYDSSHEIYPLKK